MIKKDDFFRVLFFWSCSSSSSSSSSLSKKQTNKRHAQKTHTLLQKKKSSLVCRTLGKVFSTTQKRYREFWICFYDTLCARRGGVLSLALEEEEEEGSRFLLCIYTVDVLEYY